MSYHLAGLGASGGEVDETILGQLAPEQAEAVRRAVTSGQATNITAGVTHVLENPELIIAVSQESLTGRAAPKAWWILGGAGVLFTGSLIYYLMKRSRS